MKRSDLALGALLLSVILFFIIPMPPDRKSCTAGYDDGAQFGAVHGDIIYRRVF